MKRALVLCVVGPTSSGKSELAVRLAKKLHGEIISADSRQIYRDMNIGTGKVEGHWINGVYSYKSIPHYLIDEASPRLQYSVAKFQTKAQKLIDEITARGHVPIICGGTGHWIDAAVLGQSLPEVKPNAKLRASLSKKSTVELFAMLKKLDPNRAKTIDAKNPRRLIRAIEIIKATGKVVPKLKTQNKYDITWIGINPSKEILDGQIEKRLNERLKAGLLREVKKLHTQGLSWKKLEAFGLEYKYGALHLQGKITKKELTEQLLQAIKQYAKRQLTWWKRNPNIQWFDKAPTKI